MIFVGFVYSVFRKTFIGQILYPDPKPRFCRNISGLCRCRYSKGYARQIVTAPVEDTIKVDDFRDAVYSHYYDYPTFHMVKKHYGIRTECYKLMHFYDEIDTWELYDLEEDPNEIHNQIDNLFYDEVKSRLRKRLIDLQRQYQVTN
ncbi:MAG: sulfatase/phosphatase domain-containing protein [Flagellimonas sp.]